VVVFYGAHVRSTASIIVACAAGTAGLAATGTLYGALAAGVRVRETLLPFLWLPVVAPVLLAGTRAWQAALGTVPARTADALAPPHARLRRRLPGPRRRHLRPLQEAA
jgi:ABC-type transport system involved in cytochrome c biogenesis permease component